MNAVQGQGLTRDCRDRAVVGGLTHLVPLERNVLLDLVAQNAPELAWREDFTDI